jgi:hypothetical protein
LLNSASELLFLASPDMWVDVDAFQDAVSFQPSELALVATARAGSVVA